MKKKVGIIGGSGFIGSYVTKEFLNNGFEVKVSATDISKEEKYQHLMALENADNLHVSELNVTNKKELFDFVSDCDVVIHGGTPFILDVTDPKSQLFDPTIDGTNNFLEAVRAAERIEKIIIIASVAAYNTNFPLPANGKSDFETFDETTPPFTSNESHPYAQAKFIANQVVEKFIADNPLIKFEISSVSPVMVAGKSLSARQDSTSGGMQHLFKNNIAPNPFVQMLFDQNVRFSIVDVADVATAIFKIATGVGTHGKNYLLSSESYRVSDMHLMLNQKDPLEAPLIVYKNDLAKKDLGISFTPAKTTLNNYSK